MKRTPKNYFNILSMERKLLLNFVTRDLLIRQIRYLVLLKRFHCYHLNQNLKNQPFLKQNLKESTKFKRKYKSKNSNHCPETG